MHPPWTEYVEGRITERRLYDIYHSGSGCEFELSLLVSVMRPGNVDKFLKRADAFIRFKENLLLDGNEIQEILNTGPTPLIGEIQADIHRQRFLGTIRNRAECRRWILSNFT
jgi:hypothetical protein